MYDSPSLRDKRVIHPPFTVLSSAQRSLPLHNRSINNMSCIRYLARSRASPFARNFLHQPAIAHIHPSDDGHSKRKDSSPASFSPQTRFHYSSTMGAFRSLNKCSGFPVSPRFGASFYRPLSTANDDSGHSDIAENEAIASSSHTAAVNDVPPAPADSFTPGSLVQHLIDAVHCYTSFNWWASIVIVALISGGVLLSQEIQNQLQEHVVTTIVEENETACWGCGLRLLLPSYAPVFKCGWCGAITNQNEHSHKHQNEVIWWRRVRDRSFACVLFSFMLFVICGGVWAVYPVVFSTSFFNGVSHSIITAILSITTVLMFCLSAFRCAGTPPAVHWGDYPNVGKGYLENYTFCHYCCKPKSPRSHHCRSCGMCILDMDHHCPFIGNCVGAANHRHFIAFLISAIISTMYVTIMSAYTVVRLWPPLQFKSLKRGIENYMGLRILKEIVFAFMSSALLLSTRGLVLVYLFFSSISVNIGLTVLLCQQLSYIYQGKTYLSHLISQGSDEIGEKDCKNIFRFFGCPYSVSRYFSSSPKTHEK